MTLYEENINLQEALVRESKSGPSGGPPMTPKGKIPKFSGKAKALAAGAGT